MLKVELNHKGIKILQGGKEYMEVLKTIILKNIAEQIKKTALAAVGTTSYWGMYQAEEPHIIRKEIL